MSEATYYRYQKLFEEDDIAAGIFEQVTGAFIESLELDISTRIFFHIESDFWAS